MSWVYPNATIESQSWYPYPPGWAHHETLQEGDSEYIYTPPTSYGDPNNRVRLRMPALCTTCEIRVARSASYNPTDTVVLVVRFGTLPYDTWTINLMQQSTHYTTYTYTPTVAWDEIEIRAVSSEPAVLVSLLRGAPAPTGSLPKRLLTGVGI